MSTVDPAVERAHQARRRRDRPASRLVRAVVTVGYLVTGYLFGRGLAGIVAALIWSTAQADSELSTSQMPPYWWGLEAGLACVGLLLWDRYESRRFPGGFGRPVVGLSLAVAATAFGVWLQGLRWTGPDDYWTDGVRHQATQHDYWLVEHSDWWLPIVCLLVALAIPACSLGRAARRKAKEEWIGHLRDSGLRARGTVTEVRPNGGGTDDRPLVDFTVKFTDQAGVQRWVRDRATFVPAAMPSVGAPATVLYDPDHLRPEKIVVTLEPRQPVKQQLYDQPSRPPAVHDTAPAPPWGSPDAPDQGGTEHGNYRDDAI